ncbi:MAG TPA: hypothetical protein VH109_14015 [Steroidobacteraceae bacterium]|nr:hypothetical protein [Steroidobacteraceae bacterium]
MSQPSRPVIALEMLTCFGWLAALAALTLAGLGTGLLLSLGWRDYVLCVVLPLAGTTHLVLLCRQMPAPSGPES